MIVSREPLETSAAWMAGFVDGEGMLTISRQRRIARPSPAYRVYISVSNTNRDVLGRFVTEYGGKIYHVHERRQDRHAEKWADAFDWYCPVSSSERMLRDLLPYLLLKRRQAMVLLEFLATKHTFARTHWPGRGKGSAPLTQEEIDHREALRIRVQLLNTKGPRARAALSKEPAS